MKIGIYRLNNFIIYSTIFFMLSSLVTKLFLYKNYPIFYYFFALLAFLSLLINCKYFFNKSWELKFFFPFILMLISILLYYTFSEILWDTNNINSLSYIFDIFLNGLVWFFIGCALYFFDFSNKKIFFPLIISLILFFSIVVNMNGGFFIDYYTLRQSIQDNSISHLHFGNFFVLIIIISFLLAKKNFKLPIFFLGLMALFGVGGRSNFYIFLFTIILILLFFLKKIIIKNSKKIFIISFLFILIVCSMDTNIGVDTIGRMAISKDTMDEDDSYLARIDFLNFAISKLGSNFLYGDPNILIKKYGYINSYAHNLLSAWQFFGFFTFLSITLLLIYSFFRISLALFENRSYFYNENFMLGFFILIYMTFSLILTKGVSFTFLWLGFGYIMCQISFLNKKMV